MHQKACTLRPRLCDDSRGQKQVAADPAAVQPKLTPASRQENISKGLPGGASLAYLTTKSGHHHDVPLFPDSPMDENRQHERVPASLARPHSAGDTPLAPQHYTITQLPPRFLNSMAGRPLSAHSSLGSYPGPTVPQPLQAGLGNASSKQAQQVQSPQTTRLHGGGSPASQVGSMALLQFASLN